MPLSTVVVPVVARHPLDALGLAFYVLAFIAIAAAALRRPSYGIAALIAVVPFAAYRDVGNTTITLPKVALLAVAAALVLNRCDARGLRSPPARTLVAAGLIVAAATLVTLFQAAYREPVLRETLKALEYVALFATVFVAARADAGQTPVRIAFAASLAVVAVLAAAQEIVGAPSGFWFAGVPVPRVAGPLEGPNQLAGYLGIALATVAAFALARRTERAAPNALALAALGLGAFALALTLSRAGLLAGALSLALVFVRSPRERRRPVLVALGTGVAAGLLVVAGWGFAATHSLLNADLLARFSSLAESENGGGVGKRSDLWRAAYALWHAHPWLGIGAGNFEFEVGRVGPHGVRTHANSLYIQALVEGGLPLLFATVALVVASIGVFARARTRTPLVVAAFGASVGLAAHQIVDFLTFYPKVGELWWILLGLATASLAGSPAAVSAPAETETPVRRLRAAR